MFYRAEDSRSKLEATLFTIGWCFFIAGVLTISGRNLGLIPSTFGSAYLLQFGVLVEIILSGFAISMRFRRMRNESELTQARASRNEIIASTTQALAHDVRKPFSMFKMIIDTVQNSKSVEEARDLMENALPEVNQAMASVDGLIQDVMQIGSDSKPMLEVVTAGSLIESAISELFRVYPVANVSLSYVFGHKQMLDVDTVRVSRVFANILGNAVQAMSEKGNIWIKTSESNSRIEFVLGNSGSSIPEEISSKLFDAFFTSGKKGGTGLGLAIAKKTVEAHGGAIFCRSEKTPEHPTGMVEFVFTLPASERVDPRTQIALPTHSSEIQATFEKFRASLLGGDKMDKYEAELEDRVVQSLRILLEKPSILIADDEAVYRNNLIAMVHQSSEIAALVEVKTAVSDLEISKAVEAKGPLLIIQDVDLGPASKNGQEVIKELRDAGFAGHICVHSNRFLDEDVNKAIAAGANFTIPKPLSRPHFLKLLLAALGVDRRVGAEAGPRPTGVQKRREEDSERPTQKPKVAYLDDTLAFLMAAKQKLGGHVELVTFRSSADFLKVVEEDAGFLPSLSLFITDFYLADSDKHDGLTFAKAAKELGLRCPVVLASEVELPNEEKLGVFSAHIGKKDLDSETIQNFLTTPQDDANENELL